MITQIVVASVMNSFKLAPSERRFRIQYPSLYGIVRALVVTMIAESQVRFLAYQATRTISSAHFSNFVPLLAVCVVWFYKKFKLHLFKLARAEGEVSRSNSLRNAFPICAITERNLIRVDVNDILKVYKHALRNFSTKVHFSFGSVTPRYTSVSKIKLLGFGPRHFFFMRFFMFAQKFLFIRPEPLVADFAFY